MIALPQCRWRGKEVSPDHYECLSPKLQAPTGVTPDWCRGCYCKDHPTPDPNAMPPKARTTCVHLGGATGERRSCQSCAGAVAIKVMACAVHGQCTTVKKFDDLTCCRDCGDYRLP